MFRRIVCIYFLLILLTLVFTVFVFNSYRELFLNTIEYMAFEKRDIIRTNKYNFIESENIEQKKKVLVFGDSTTASGFKPLIFDKYMDDLTYSLNLSITSHDIRHYYFMLKEFISNQYVPNIIILNVSYERKPYIMLNGSFEEKLNYFKSSPLKINQKLAKMFPFINKDKVFNNNFISKYKVISFKKDALKYMINNRGTYYWRKKKDYFQLISAQEQKLIDANLKIEYIDKIISKDYLFWIEKFINLTIKYNIKVFLIDTHKISNKKNIDFIQIPNYLKLISDKYSNVYLYNPMISSFIYGPEYSYDGGYHLNNEGANLYTLDIAKNFDNIFKIK